MQIIKNRLTTSSPWCWRGYRLGSNLMHFDFKVFHTVSCHLELAEGSLSTARNRQKNSEFLQQALDDKDSDITW